MANSPPDRRVSVARAALAGLMLAGLVAGVAFLINAVRLLRGTRCAGLSPDECALEQQIATTVGQTHLGLGMGLLLLALAIFLWLRGHGPLFVR